MNFSDIIRDNFTGGIPTEGIILTLVVAFGVALYISFIYKQTYIGVSYTKNAMLTIVLLAMVTSLVIRTINSNLALSLGMIGALSIVRFRTAVKDPIDTIFMFWAITVGIMAGAGLYVSTVLASLLLGILYILSQRIVFKPTKKYLLIIKANENGALKIIDFVSKEKKTVLKTQSIKNQKCELTFEITGDNASKLVLDVKAKDGVESAHLVNIT